MTTQSTTSRILETFRVFLEPGQVCELRALNVPFKHWSGEERTENRSGFFDLESAEKFAHIAANLSGRASVYFTPNPLSDGFRSHAKFGEFSKAARGDNAKDNDIARRRWLLVDLDPERSPANVSANDTEKGKAWRLVERILEELEGLGWPEPIVGDSGNGFHLCYRIDLSNDDESNNLVSGCLAGLKESFWSASVKIDQSVSNAARIWKLYGTLSIKGRDTPARPHRVARILRAPDRLEVVPAAKLLYFSNLARAHQRVPVAVGGGSWSRDRVLRMLDRGGIKVNPGEFQTKGGPSWTLEVCPFIQGVHGGGRPGMNTTMVGIGGDGIPWFCCHGDRCKGKRKFTDLVELVEPGYKEHKRQRQEIRDRRDKRKRASKEKRKRLESQETRHHEMTDLGNARRFKEDHQDSILYVPDWQQWMHWDQYRWARDSTLEHLKKAQETVEKIKAEADSEGDPEIEEELYKHAKRSQSDRAIRSLISQARPMVSTSREAFNRDPWLLNVMNGTLDLKTGTLRNHDRRDMITKVSPVEYDEDAKAPRWLDFLTEVLDGNQVLIDFLGRCIGYTLTGVVSEEVLFLLYGQGSNGKSKVINAVSGLLGDYAVKMDAELLEVKYGSSHPTSIADLYQNRMAHTVETEQARRISEKTVKQLASNDSKLTARRMRQDFFNFTPTHKLWLAGNHFPRVLGDDHGIWRRFVVIHFPIEIPRERWDLELDAKFAKEYAGILAWAVRACLDWQRNGFRIPDCVRQKVEDYKSEEDVVGRFIDECCIVDPGVKVKASELFSRFKEWSRDDDERRMGATAFGRKLSSKGFDRVKSGCHWRHGICLDNRQ